jgi:hypothetical protein
MSTQRTLESVAPGLTADSIREMLARNGMTVVAKPAPKWPSKERKMPGKVRRPRAESVALAAQMRSQGKDNADIAAALGVTRHYVSELLPREENGKKTKHPPANRVKPMRQSVRMQNVQARREKDREFAIAKRKEGWTMAVIAGALDRSPRYVQDILPQEWCGNLNKGHNAEVLRTHPKCVAMRGARVVREAKA